VTTLSWQVDEVSLDAFKTCLGVRHTPDWFALRREAEELALRPSFGRLITLDHNTIKELPHQIKVAEQVLSRGMLGRAILADEVGLGKTIEAGIVMKELSVRGLARRVLILTPAALVDQWQGELESKFFERFGTPMDPGDWERMPRAIASISRARMPKHSKAILKQRWDLVIVDEAHKIKNSETKAYKLVSDIERNYTLLLTATPLQNDLRELYNLVNLIRPGQMGTWREFREKFIARGSELEPNDPNAIKDLTASVMVRTRRASVADAVSLPPRHPVHPRVDITQAEAALYRDVVAFLRDLYRRGFHKPSADERAEDQGRRKRRTGKGIQSLERIRLCRRLCSSSHALAQSLKTVASGELVVPEFRTRALDLATTAANVQDHAKLNLLKDMLANARDRVIVFSEHLPTIKLISEGVKACGRPAVLFHGQMSRRRRTLNLARFRDDPQSVFVATKAGTEGLNLQFCNKMVNYDLPWNPMVIEQRIGRIHRIGQERETYIINLAAAGTVEQRVLELLDRKIRLFELVVGELDVILGDFGGAESLEKRLVDAWLDADTDEKFDERLEEIGNEIEKSRDAGLEQERRNSELVVEDAAERLDREFAALSVPARIKLGYGTSQMVVARGVEAKRHQLGVHVNEILEMLSTGPAVQDAGTHAEYGSIVRVTGVTGRSREVTLVVQADRLPMVFVDIFADEEAPLIPAA